MSETQLEEGQRISTAKLLDDEVVLHPEISKWRDALRVDLRLLNSLRDGQIAPTIFRILKDGKHQLVAGARRYCHQKLLGTSWEDIPKDIKENLSERDALLMAASENFFRKDFNPWEEARAINSLLGRGKFSAKNLAKKLGVSVSYINNRRALLQLPVKIRQRFEAKDIPIGYVAPLLKLKGLEEAQNTLLDKIISGRESSYYGISTVKEGNEFVTKALKEIKDMEAILAKYGPCPKCGSKEIKYPGWGDEDQLTCKNCDHEWHRETKEAWEYYELKQKAEEMGFEVEEGPEKVKFTPKEVAKIIEDKAREERIERGEEEAKVDEKFRSAIPLETILAPLIHENIQKIDVKGLTIEVHLIEDPDLWFRGYRKDYKAGEKARIEALTSWRMDNEQTLQESAKNIHALIKRLS